MACDPFHPVACATGAVADAATASLGNSFADAMREGASWVIKTTIGWWIEVPAIDLVSSPAAQVRGYVWWLALVVAAAGVLAVSYHRYLNGYTGAPGSWRGLRFANCHTLVRLSLRATDG